MRTRLLGMIPLLAVVALVLGGATTPEQTVAVVGAALLSSAVAAASVGVTAVSDLRIAAGRRPGARALPLAEPAPAHPGTPGRARPRAPGRGLLAA